MNFENKTLGSFSSTRNEMILNFGVFELFLKSLVKDLMSNYAALLPDANTRIYYTIINVTLLSLTKVPSPCIIEPSELDLPGHA